jgi:hypothetical protein
MLIAALVAVTCGGSGGSAASSGEVAFETGVHGLAAAADSIWVLDLHGPRIVDQLRGSTIWRLDPDRLVP